MPARTDLDGPAADSPFAVETGEPGPAPCRNGPLEASNLAAPAPFFFVSPPRSRRHAATASACDGAAAATRRLLSQPVVVIAAVLLRSLAAPLGCLVADRPPRLFQPVPRPGELQPQDRKPSRYQDNRGSGRYDHDDAEQQHGKADDGDRDAPCDLVRNSNQSVHWR